jgi:serine phosphatase RsbU (regulator of sigma subunit)
MLKQKTFKTHKIHYERGDRLYLYSDGYFDQFGGESNAKLNKGKFKELLIEVSKESPEEARERLHSYFNEWKGVNKQLDDVLVIGTEL